MDLLHSEKTKELRGLIYNVRNTLEAGWSEEVYHQALLHELRENNIPTVSKFRRSLVHRSAEIHLFEPDLIVWDTIILELKALPYQHEFSGEQYAQLIHYLKFFGKDLGLLVNFGPSRVKIKRVIWNEPKLEILEDYEKIKSGLSDQDRNCLRQIRQHVLTIANQFGLGYPETTYRKLIAIELLHHELPCVSDMGLTAVWHNQELSRHTTSHLHVADSYLLHNRSLLERPAAQDFAATKTYLKNLGLRFGLIVNFGRKQLQIFDVKSD
jgi:GxxExxY protein